MRLFNPKEEGPPPAPRPWCVSFGLLRSGPLLGMMWGDNGVAFFFILVVMQIFRERPRQDDQGGGVA